MNELRNMIDSFANTLMINAIPLFLLQPRRNTFTYLCIIHNIWKKEEGGGEGGKTLSPTFRLTFYDRWSADPHYANLTRPRLSPHFFRACSQAPEAESATGVEDGCSEGSEVDWSWLEEVECLRTAKPLAAGERDAAQEGDAPSPTDEGGGRRRACDRRETAATRSAAMSVTATAKSPAIGGSRWPSPDGALFLDRQNNNNNNNVGRHRNVNDTDEDVDDDDDNEAERCNATNEAVDRENRYCTTTTTTSAIVTGSSTAGSIAATANSWMRASMRRLRHLRLPEGATREPANRRAASVSAPNSLPDIALIAPEILAAQTNGATSGALLRPSSAPARNAAAPPAPAGVATPRRAGRQFAGGGRSRNREAASSRQGSLGSTTTASDITASGNTTCSSGASTSPASSTATTPQRATSRRSVHDFIERMIGNVERCDRFMIDLW